MKQIFQKISENRSQVYVWKVVSAYENLLNQSTLCYEELQALELIKSKKRKIEFLTTRMAVKSILGENIKLKHKTTGQPYVDEECHISIAHSKSFVTLAVGDQSIGVDIERPSEKIVQVLPRILSKKEWTEFQKNPSEKVACQLWGAKEATLKLVGDPKLNYSEDICLEKITPVKISCKKLKLSVVFEEVEGMVLSLVTKL